MKHTYSYNNSSSRSTAALSGADQQRTVGLRKEKTTIKDTEIVQIV